MNATAPPKERDMYPKIKSYFQDALKCEPVIVDGEGGVRLQKNLHIGKIDVAALKDPNGKACEVHLIEAKLFTHRQAFEECVNQIDAVRDSADRLWVAFPEDQWKSLSPTDHERNEKRLYDLDLGLLLVTPEECYAKRKAPRNPHVNPSARVDVLQQLGFAIDPFLPSLPILGSVDAKTAAGVMALTCMVAGILEEIGRKKVNFRTYWEDEYESDHVVQGWFIPAVQLAESVNCEIDPFGRYLGDGVPAAWVEVNVLVEDVLARLDRDHGFGTHVYVDDGEWEWKMIPVADGAAAVRYWMDYGLDENTSLCARVEIVGRMETSLKSDLGAVIKDASSFLSAGAANTRRTGKKVDPALP